GIFSLLSEEQGVRQIFATLLLLLGVCSLKAQPLIRLKTRQFDPVATRPFAARRARLRNSAHRSHLIVQFSGAPTSTQTAALTARGATVLGYVPDDSFAVSAPDDIDLNGLGVRWAGELNAEDKLSPLLPSPDVSVEPGYAIVEFYPDVDLGAARLLVLRAGLELAENPDLTAHELLVVGAPGQAMELAKWDEVSYIFPASRDLVRGVPVNACSGALTTAGAVTQNIPIIGDGWDGPGLGAANLLYAFTSLTSRLTADSAKAEIVRAFNEWAKYAKLTFAPTANTRGPATLDVLFASGDHGDGYPFDGPGGMLAHTFYPAPPNPEPIAGDLHFDNDENWRIGSGTDLFSVALHEAGHALGLGHSDQPGDVMYPYYKQVTGLSVGDIAAVQQLYAAPSPSGTPSGSDPGTPDTPTTPPSLILTVNAAPATTTVASISLAGSTYGGTGAVQVAWASDQGPSGVAQGSGNWIIPSLALNRGPNVVTIRATDSTGASVSQTVAVTRTVVASTTPAQTPTTPAEAPSVQILAPTSGTPYSASTSSVVVTGVASQSSGIDHVDWVNSSGGSGTGSGTTNWSTGIVALQLGVNVVTVRAYGKDGTMGASSVQITYSPANTLPDITPPSLTIVSPSGTVVSTTLDSIAVSGTATDNVGVTAVAWSTSTGSSGAATGTTMWTVSAIPLWVGTNNILIQARDAAGNVAWRSLTVSRR
ncbi:MAG: matrixin family metalloprotease, partial [Bryobacteraceae bacterium]